jgi:hypothetical protein
MNYPYYNQMPANNSGNQIPQNNTQNNIPQQMPQMNYNQMMNQQYQRQQTLFPSPIGNVYSLNTAADIENVPAGMNMSLGLCLQENILYIKALQNGSPMLLGYRLLPLEGGPSSSQKGEKEEISSEVYQKLEELSDRFAELEEQVNKIKAKIGGGKSEWPL